MKSANRVFGFVGEFAARCASDLCQFRKVICRVARHFSSTAIFLVPRTGFGGSAGAFSALVVTGSLSSCEPENANQQQCHYPHITDLYCSGLTERPLQMLGRHPQGQIVSVAQIVLLCLMAIITSAFDLRQLFASACESC